MLIVDSKFIRSYRRTGIQARVMFALLKCKLVSSYSVACFDSEELGLVEFSRNKTTSGLIYIFDEGLVIGSQFALHRTVNAIFDAEMFQFE